MAKEKEPKDMEQSPTDHDKIYDLGDLKAMNSRGGEINTETLKILEKQPKVTISIPILEGKDAPKHLDLGVNGAIFRVERGKNKKVPQSIAEAYYNSMNV